MREIMRKYLVTFIMLALMAMGAMLIFTSCSATGGNTTANSAQNNVKCTTLSTAVSAKAVSGDVLKVVNVTDGSYRLKDADYSVEGGEVKVSETYLKTLEADTEYTFRAVTASADYDFTVKTDFTAVTLAPEKSGFEKGEDVSFKVSGNVTVTRLEINGAEYEFAVNGDVITLSAEAIKNLTGGKHTVKAYTSLGRPTASFDYSGLPDFREEEVQPVSRTFLWVDLAVFGVLIAGYVGFTVFNKMRKNKKG